MSNFLLTFQEGSVEITSHQTKESAVVHFRNYKKVSKDYLKLTGSVSDKSGDVVYHLEGGWMEGLRAKPCEGKLHVYPL